MPATAILRVKDEKGNTYDIPAIRGRDGKDGKDGKDGYTPQKGVDYFDGKDGKDGEDGYTPQKGVDYFDGKDGKDGEDGEDLQGWASVTDNNTEISFTPADKTEYRFPNATSVTINCPTDVTEYECWIYIGGANASFSIVNATQIGTASASDYSNISAIEISIKDGRYVVGFSGELI